MIKKDTGFTLIEMLVVIAILSIFGVLLVTIFTRSLRGSNKSQITGRLKQNGQSILEQMDKTVRNSDNIVCVSPPDPITPKTTLVVKTRGKYTRYRFIPPLPAGCTGSACTANGSIQQDNPEKTLNEATSREETETEFKNRICAENNGMPQAIVLTDTSKGQGVSIFNGGFELNPSPGYSNQVRISFEVKPGVSVPISLSDQVGSLIFQTTIQLR